MKNSRPRLQVMEVSHPDDLQLAQSAVSGDQQAAAALARRLLPRIRTTVRYIVGNAPESLDFVQDALVEILCSLHGFQGKSSLETWSDRIAVRLVMKKLKAARKTPTMASWDLETLESRLADPETGTGRALLQERMAELLGHLYPERRLTMVLHEVYGYTAPEIAEITGVKVNTVRDRIKQGRRKLRRLIAEDPVFHWLKRHQGGAS